ncbi:hypothetical protein JOD62_001859 [Microbacterium keratanolyticum]|uniref:DUF1206 domain-containing protein n=1 Tax=Microbacterium keratanolyticum TaxID=67574 RepID=A0A9W6HR77_9MICO|nr:DUF1206 domain-containing protein [Microbacterium keratanolyticum]MBM7469311.1 hypothetical protein [Microbacterium keratanolyticum]GLK01392.1 hypothetical protein GCM10017596_11070 [Microbacterium keratanolyticum]
MRSEARRAARKAESSTILRVLARAGFAANGVVHVLIGSLVLAVALGGRGESDQAGAFKALAAAPFGFALLWVLAAALWALALWHVLDGILAPRGSAAQKWGRRVSEWSQAAVFLVIGILAASVALGARPDADETAADVSRGVLFVPGGVFVLGGVGAGFAIAGVAFAVMGVRRSFVAKMRLPDGPVGHAVTALGAAGFIAKGLSLMSMGVLLLVAAFKVDPDAVGGLDAAIAALLEMPFGPALTLGIGAGLVLYGVFCGFRGRYADL